MAVDGLLPGWEGWFLPMHAVSQEPVRSISPTTPKRVEWLGNMRWSKNCWNVSFGRIYAACLPNDGYIVKTPMRRWYIHDLEREFFVDFCPTQLAARYRRDSCALGDAGKEWPGTSAEEIAIWCYDSYIIPQWP